MAAGRCPNYAKLGRGFCGERTLAPGPGPRVRVARALVARPPRRLTGWRAPQCSCHPPPRVLPLCEPAALWLRSHARRLARARRPRAEEPERSSRGLWRPLAAARRCAARPTAPPPLVPQLGILVIRSWGSWLSTSLRKAEISFQAQAGERQLGEMRIKAKRRANVEAFSKARSLDHLSQNHLNGGGGRTS